MDGPQTSRAENSPFAGARLDPDDGPASMEAGLGAMQAWWQQHQASLPAEHREFLGRLVEQTALCLRVAAAPTAPTGTSDPVHESVSWIDLIEIWSRVAMAVAGTGPERPPKSDARDRHETDDIGEPLRRFRDEHEDALCDYLLCLHSVSAQTLNDAREAQGDGRASVEEEPLRSLYGRLMEMGEARYLELAGSQDYARLLARLVNTLLRLERAQKGAASRP